MLTPVSSSAATDGTDCPKGQEQGSFHVFLSIRGPDVRRTFLGHLYNAFIREGIRVYIDDGELRKGKEIDGSLMRAIKDSRIAVVLFSENYASSRWCLDELAKIMERSKEGKLVVKPVFYRVDPKEVRTPRKSFAKALADHEAKLGKDSDKVKRWREALFEAGCLSGWHLDAKGHEAELVRSIIKDVNVLLDCPLLDVAKYPVVRKVEELPYEEALQLFSRQASLESNQTSISMDLVDRFLHYAKGLPLALTVLGSLLRDRPENFWKSTLKKLEDSPAEDIDKVLRVSIDGLERNEREIFLDIPCFFNGSGENYIEVMDACGFEASIGIDGYTNKQVQMHDLLQLTGKSRLKNLKVKPVSDVEVDLIRETPSSATTLFMLTILVIGFLTLAIIALHFYKTHTNKRLSLSLTPVSSSAATDGTGSTFSTSPNLEQSPGGGTDCPKGQEQGSFHVFLSFCSPDVRHTLLGHLYDAFIREGIRMYIDDEEHRKGEEIDGSLMRAIEDSRIAVLLLSENYASSRWCLDVLAKIMERWKEGKLVVKPVFYRVDPREVRTPRKSFAKALAVHEAKLKKDLDKVKRWREALFKAGSLSGWHLDAKGHEAELVRSITKDVNVLLDRPLLHVATYPVGIGARVEQIKDLLRLESGEVLLLGLWGMGGVGKTTLAKSVFNAIADQFEGCAFLQNVREESTNPCIGLTKLQEKLLSEVLQRKDVKVSSTAGGISMIKDRLSSKKVLLLLDDLSDSEQLDALAGGLHWFGRGSRILITTRDSSLLTVCNEYVVHKVEELPYEEALQLFRRHAFLESNQTSITKDLVDRCLHYAKGLPLALTVLGSLLRDRPEHLWKSTLKKLEDSPAKDIDKVLRVSIDGLERNEREIFLDIACFFNGSGENYIEKVMDACGFKASIGLQILIERSLITIDGYTNKQVQMHDLLQLTGKNIVCENFPDEPASRSRLWEYDDVLDVISSGDETNAVKAIVVHLSNPMRISVDANALTKFRKLRLLIMRNVTYYGDHLNFPSGLIWMEWYGYCASTFVFSRNTAFKHMRHINLERCQ